MASSLSAHPSAEHLSAWLEGGLPRAQRRQLEAHLCACGDCRRLAACASLLVRRHAPPPRPWALGWHAPLALAATAILAAGLWWLPQSRSPLPPPPAAPISPSALPVMQPLQVLPSSPALSKPHIRPARPAPAAPPRQWAPSATPAPLRWAVALPPPPPVATPAPAPIVLAADGFREQAPSLAARPTLAAWGGATPEEPAFSAISLPQPAALLAASAPSSANVFPAAASFASPPASGNSTALAEDLVRTDAMLDAALRTAWNAMPVPHRTQIHVRILVTRGAREWAGGRADELFTSADHGLHWQRILLPGLPTPPPLLRSIAFPDSTHGTITARNGQRWTSSDAGRSWSLQP